LFLKLSRNHWRTVEVFERQILSDTREILSSIIIVSQTQLLDQTQNVQSLNKKNNTRRCYCSKVNVNWTSTFFSWVLLSQINLICWRVQKDLIDTQLSSHLQRWQVSHFLIDKVRFRPINERTVHSSVKNVINFQYLIEIVYGS
jgi:hypothetical protein